MNTIPCAVIRDLLPLYAENMTSEKTRTLVGAHLAECSDCVAALAEQNGEIPAAFRVNPDAAKPLRGIRKRLWGYAAALVLLVSLLWGLFLTPGDEMGYSLLVFYFLLPLCALVCTAIPAAQRGKLRFFLPLVFGAAGIGLPFAVFGTFDWLSLCFGLVPSVLGLGLGILISRAKKTRMRGKGKRR